jgi:hypothetical protein
MGTIASQFPYDTRSPRRVPIGKAATAYGFALRLVACGLTILQEAWSISGLSVNAGIDVRCPFAEMTADPEIIEKSKR